MSSFTGLNELLYNIVQLVAEEYGDDSGRCFVCTKTMIVSDIGCGLTKQISVNINSLQDTSQNQQELD